MGKKLEEYKKNNIDKIATKIGATVLMYSATKASEIQAKMKINRPWTDRTGMAKARLNTSVSKTETGSYRITLAHGVDYGLWLELAHEKRFAIVKPTIELKGNDVLKGYANLLDKMGY